MAGRQSAMTLGEALKQECTLRGISQNQAAKETGVSPQSFSKWATGERVPGNEQMPAVASFLYLTVEEVYKLSRQTADPVAARLDRIEEQLARLEALIERSIELAKKPRR